jgi:uncharacterized protein
VRNSLITIVASVLSIFVIAYLFFNFLGPIPFTVNQTTTNKLSTFDVTGEGTETIVPDQATASFGITTQGSSVAQVQSQINSTINRVTDSIKNLGIEDKDIKTTNYSINPDYDYTNNTIKGYSASAQIQVTFKDFDKVNQAFDIATANGANTAGQLSFGLSDEKRKEAEAKATKAAIDQAKDKAQSIAGMAGIKLGKLVNVQQSTPYQPLPYISMRTEEAQVADQKTQVEPGSSEVKVTIILSYETY